MLYGKKLLWAVLAIVALVLLPACGGGGGGGGGNTPANSDPIANAGTDQNVKTGTTVTLDGSGSYDPDGDILTFAWSLVAPAGSSATLSDNKAVRPTFVADMDGEYVVQLTVDDGTMAVLSNTVTVTATSATVNSAPVANAGRDQNVKTGVVVTLDGTGSSDADNDPLTYSWSLSAPAGSSATLSNNFTEKSTFTTDVAGNYVVRLIVNDGTVNSVPDTVIVTATPASVNSAPVANAGPNQSVAIGSVVTLDGSASSDADNDSLTYSWNLSAPDGSSATLSNSTALQPTFTPDRAGEYLITLTVFDGKLNDSDTILVKSSYEPLFTVGGLLIPVTSVPPDGFYIAGTVITPIIRNDSSLNFILRTVDLLSQSDPVFSTPALDKPLIQGESLFIDFVLENDEKLPVDGIEVWFNLELLETAEKFTIKYSYDN